MAVSLNGTNGITFNDSSTQNTAATGFGFKNRIINGAMMIDQRNAGASVSVNNTLVYTIDRWIGDSRGAASNGVISFQRSSTAPAGFVNSLSCTLTTPRTSAAAGDVFAIYHKIEGYNVADFGFGTANATPITVSFQVRSSITGTYSGAVSNSAQNRSYPFTFTINSANTFETKTVTIPGDTSGTWLTDNGTGLILFVNLGCGSTYLGTANTWAGAAYLGATGSTNWATGATSSTFYITGVQLEKGSTATSFDYRPYQSELALCQRYYFKTFQQGTAPAQSASYTGALMTSTSATTTFGASLSFPVTMRTAPSTVTTYNPAAANANWRDFNNGADRSAFLSYVGDSSLMIYGTSGIVNGLNAIQVTASAEL